MEALKDKKRKEMIEQILNKRVQGETYISSSDWKIVVINHFNKVHRKEMSVEELIVTLQKNGVKFTQSAGLVQYPVKELLGYIASVSKKEIDI